LEPAEGRHPTRSTSPAPQSAAPAGLDVIPAPQADLDAACRGPDVAAEALALHDDGIEWVGMQGIDLPILFDGGNGNVQNCRARVDAFVDLKRPDRRGIHMSRLYLLVNRHLAMQRLDAAMLESLLWAFLKSHEDLASRARIVIRFEHLVRRPALRSRHHGWRAYPVAIEAALIDGVFQLELATQVVYSSTCPASAALACQLIQQQFARDFNADETLEHAAVIEWLGHGRGIVATPHAQRSLAQMRVRFADGAALDLAALLDRVEQSLGTAVQTAVKREDEQAFARLNGENPMFCEDAVRRIRRALDSAPGIAGFSVRVEHQESLHPHDAVAQANRNLPGCASTKAGDHGFPI
jgi:GTP cyclohydrolase I